MKWAAVFLLGLSSASCSHSHSEDDQKSSIRLPEDSLYLNEVGGPCGAADRFVANQVYVTDDKDQHVDSVHCDDQRFSVQWKTPSNEYLQSVRFGEHAEVIASQTDLPQVSDPIGKTWGSDGKFLRLDGRNRLLESIASEGARQITYMESAAIEDYPTDSTISGERLCHSRDPLFYIAPSIHLSLVAQPQNSSRVVMMDTCGFVDVAAYEKDGKRLWNANVWERGGAEEFWGISSGGLLVAAPDHVLAVVPNRPRVSSKEPRPDLSLIFKVIGGGGKVQGESSEAYRGDFVPSPQSGAVCGPFAFLTGRLSHAIEPLPNDTNEDDVWLGKIDLNSGKLVKQSTLHFNRDDFGWGIACDETGIFVAGEAGKHHVDSGSWDGGSRVLVARFDHDLNIQETLTFGGSRANRGTTIFLGRDQILVTGTWDYIPNNHLPAEESWSRGFIAVLPKSGWRADELQIGGLEGLSDLKAKRM